MSYLTSHLYLMALLMIVGITPIYPIQRPKLMPYWYEWILLVWLSGLLLFELTNPSDKSGLGWVKVSVLLFGISGVAVHLFGWAYVEPSSWPMLMYMRNQMFAVAFLLACVQILDFLSFHHLFGPWAIIIGDLMKDLARFLAVLAIFVVGFAMHVVALNQPNKGSFVDKSATKHPFSDGKITSILTLHRIKSKPTQYQKDYHPLFSCDLTYYQVSKHNFSAKKKRDNFFGT